ncbi:MAG: hypothetical protein ABJG15_07460 [Hyphomonadaceae bacterium]
MSAKSDTDSDYDDDPIEEIEITPVEYDGPMIAPIIRRTDSPAQKSPRKPLTIKPFILGAKILLVIGIIAAYPATVIMNHQINDDPVSLETGRHWAAGDIGVSATLLGRELDGPGWASDRHPWHPQAQLTALPAWQEGLRASIADHARLTLTALEGQRDQDLVAAERLLNFDDSLKATPRLQAAREALMRYDDRVAGGVAGSPQGLDFLKLEMDMTLGWAAQAGLELSDISTPGDGWLASREAVAAVYHGKARAHAAHELLSAIKTREIATLERHSAVTEIDVALNKWRSAANLKPLFVSNQGSDGLIGANHPAILAFRLSEAQTATVDAIAKLNAESTPTIVGQAP